MAYHHWFHLSFEYPKPFSSDHWLEPKTQTIINTKTDDNLKNSKSIHEVQHLAPNMAFITVHQQAGLTFIHKAWRVEKCNFRPNHGEVLNVKLSPTWNGRAHLWVIWCWWSHHVCHNPDVPYLYPFGNLDVQLEVRDHSSIVNVLKSTMIEPNIMSRQTKVRSEKTEPSNKGIVNSLQLGYTPIKNVLYFQNC